MGKKTWKSNFRELWGVEPPMKMTREQAVAFGLLGSQSSALRNSLSDSARTEMLRVLSEALTSDLSAEDHAKLLYWMGVKEEPMKITEGHAADLLKKFKSTGTVVPATNIDSAVKNAIESDAADRVPTEAGVSTPAVVTTTKVDTKEVTVTTTAVAKPIVTPPSSSTGSSSTRHHHYPYGEDGWEGEGRGIYGGGSGYSGSSSGYMDAKRMRKLPYVPRPYEFPKWKFARTIVVGDLHGCGDELVDLLDRVQFKPGEDRLISVGDIVDRGKKIAKCFEVLREYKAWLCLGNHEEPFLKWLLYETHPDYRDKWSGKNNPIDLTSRADQADSMEQLTRQDWIDMTKMQLFFRLPECRYSPLIVHAGLFPGKRRKPEEQDPFSIIRMINIEERNGYYDTVPFSSSAGKPWWDVYDKQPGHHHVIYGHSTEKGKPRMKSFSTGLDTGAVYGGHLSALVIPPPGTDGRWQVAMVPARGTHWVSSAAELSGGQTGVIGSVR